MTAAVFADGQSPAHRNRRPPAAHSVQVNTAIACPMVLIRSPSSNRLPYNSTIVGNRTIPAGALYSEASTAR